ncbi:hypothetical protein BVG16_01780 [Paenibacillus selenitireducens]|uniref:DUF2564 domain-containing protein n=1 Tax=Paenibacillus selenitireducens TaxID=1324314 RepID=A0A1T2XN26_9BACL|nr:hypothetical protein [Paenibacillus selenitireducens]OPA81093.1 hypothetical protein BVG16_01780 [Paenibacillus selenitireducens]
MSRKDSSMNEQTPLTQAQNSIDKLRHAVSQALSHPTDQSVEQAHTALERAQNAVDTAVLNETGANQQPVEFAQELLGEEMSRLNKLSAD